MIKQISVFVENKAGSLYTLSKTLADHNIDLKALSIADTAKFGILRLIVSDPEHALKVMHDANYTASVTRVIGIEVENRPGGLAEILGVMKENNITVEYLYSFVGTQCENAMIIFKVNDVNKADELLGKAGLKLITEEMV